MKTFIILFLFLFSFANAQDLVRRAEWEAKLEKNVDGPGARIISIVQGSPLDIAGFVIGDIILSVNGTIISSQIVLSTLNQGLKGDILTTLLARRGNSIIKRKVKFSPIKEEEHHGLSTYYETVTSDFGIQQRVIITKPENKKGRLPAIFIIQGLSCNSIELTPNRKGNWANHLRDITEKSGMVVIRVEKPGVGDSAGNCSKTDFKTELEGYKAAIRTLLGKDFIDPSNIIVYGSSAGSVIAPLIANEFNLKGIISDGVFYKTWFEHMLEIERRILAMNGNNESQIVEKMNQVYIPLYFGMLIQKKSFQEVINENPSLTEHNYHSPYHMYGRPLSYYQQLQDYKLSAQWEKIRPNTPVRILYGENDWIMTEFDNHLITDVLTKNNHQNFKYYKYPGLDHFNTIHQSRIDSFKGNKTGKWDPELPKLIIKWAQEMVKI